MRFRRLFPSIMLLLLVGGVPAGSAAVPATTAQAPVAAYRFVQAFPHDQSAYTQGLEFHDGRLFETTGQNPASLRRVRLRTGEVLRQVRLNEDRHFGEGLTFKNGKIWWITWQSEKGFLYDPQSFDRLGSFRYRGEGWGLTHNRRSIVMSNGTDDIVFRSPKTFRVKRRIQVRDGGTPVDRLNELEWVRGRIFANIFPESGEATEDVIAVIDPATGAVLEWIDLGFLRAAEPESAGVLNGIAYLRRSDRLFVTGKNWMNVYEIEPVE